MSWGTKRGAPNDKNKIYLNIRPENTLSELNMDDSMQLGGNIELSGFRNIDGASMVILKKIIGNYGRRFSEIANNFENLKITMKPVHETEKSENYEIHAQLIAAGKPVVSEVVERNLFVAIDNALKKIESQLS